MKSSSKMLMRRMIGLVFGAGLVLGASTGANAQGHNQRHVRNDRSEHQWQERYYRNDHTNRRGGRSRFYGGNVHSRGRAVYTGGYYGGGQHRSAYYGGGHGGGYYSNGHNRGGHRGYGARYAPHHDSHNPIVRFFHHALGGH